MSAPSGQPGADAAVLKHPANDYDMAINRVVIITTLFAAAILVGHSDESISFDFVARLYLLYLCCAFAIFAHVSFRPEKHRFRRVFAMVLDICALSYVSAYVGPNLVCFLYPAYLLIIYGYGFRFGQRWLIASAAMSFAGVCVVVAASPVWQASGLDSGGLLVGLVIMPTYAHKLVRNLWQAKALAEESNRAKSMFVAAVSHDLRTPLNAIIGLGDILAASKSTEDADMARMIGEAGRALLRQIDSILDFSRLEIGRAPVVVEPVDLYAMLLDVRELLEVSARTKDVALSLTVDGRVPRRILTSPRHLRDSLTNLVGNAIKFTSEGTVDITVREIPTDGAAARLRFEVRDTGIGISAEAQKQIFERFTQADDSIRDRFGGSGLGLAIVRQLVQALRGEIGVVSAEGEGSTFWFEVEVGCAPHAAATEAADIETIVCSEDPALLATARGLCKALSAAPTIPALAALLDACGERLPGVILDAALCGPGAAFAAEFQAIARRLSKGGLIVVADEAHPGIPVAVTRQAILRRPVDAHSLADALYLVAGTLRPRAPQPTRLRSAGTSILVAEDNRTNQKVIAKMLQLSGRRAEVVGDGQAALDLLAQTRFDVVLMDINMPVLDGVEATRRLRVFERNLGRRTPVVALTADVTAETRARCMAAGMDECVTKPIDLPLLLKTLDAVAGTPGETVEAVEELAVDASVAIESLDVSQSGDEPMTGLNRQALADLERLGGPDFVREVATQFTSDAALLLKSLAAAVRDADVETFRDEAHALRSCSANVGARAIYELCLSWREISPAELAATGAECVERLEREFEIARRELEPWLEEAA